MTSRPRNSQLGDPARLAIRPLEAADPEVIAAAFTAIGWNKPASQYARYLEEQARGTRDVLVAEQDAAFAGYVTIQWQPTCLPFRDASIPEIQDLNVLPAFRRRGIASRLLDDAESRIAAQGELVRIGVGMTEKYGAAQRLYIQRGYVPDGRGLMSNDQPVAYWSEVRADDDLVLYLVKRLSPGIADGLEDHE